MWWVGLAAWAIIILALLLRHELRIDGLRFHWDSELAKAVVGNNRGAFVIGRHIFVAGPWLDGREMNHERVHVEQFRRYGYIGFFARYLYYQWFYGYANNPMEREARRREATG